jgi:3-oxoadipate enol-lactonase
MPFADSHGTRIYWRLQGEQGRPVVMLMNSIGTDQTLFDAVAPLLVDDYRLLRVDTRGHGASDVPHGDYSLEGLADDMFAVMDAADIRSATLCGVSLGGMIAMTMALRAPDRVDALLPACTSARMDRAFWQQRIDTVRREGMRAVSDAALSRLFSDAFAKARPAALDTARHVFEHIDPEGYAGCGGGIRDMDLIPRLGEIGMPTLVVGGEEDSATPIAEHGRAIAEGIPGAELLVLPGGHLACVEQPQAFADAVRSLAARARVAA